MKSALNYRALSLAPALLAGYLISPVAAVASQTDDKLDTVIVTGSRGSEARTVTTSPSPIDVIDSSQLERTGETNLKTALQKALPSYQVRSVRSNSNDSVHRPAKLRGLGAADVLVLVNGKRRHTSSSVHLGGLESNGATSVDLELIPVSAIHHVEVLRDGAAAQYGSDAVAGVINIILKETDHGGSASAYWGEYFEGDGENLKLAANKGFALPNDGFINLAIDGRSEQTAVKSLDATGAFYHPVNGQPDPRETTVSRKVSKNGKPKVKGFNGSYNLELPINDDVSLYSFSTYTERDSRVGQNFRRPNSTNIIEAIYPDGTAPFVTFEETDWQVAGGVKGLAAGWDWDLSTTYGRNEIDHGSRESLNASLGPSSPTSFWTYTSESEQWTTNLDFSRAFDVGLSKPLQFSWGAEYREDAFKTISGDPLSYAAGTYQYPAGSPLAGQFGLIGAQGAITLLPEDEADVERSNYAGYVDIGFYPTEKLYVGLAGRYEEYDDAAGDTTSGKLSLRYEFTPAFALRGTINNGFRAPSLSQTSFARSQTAYTSINGQAVHALTKTAAVDSELARALGATDLKPEKSTNISVGFTWKPVQAANVTLDVYQVKIKDRISGSTYFSGTAVDNLLDQLGYQPGYRVQYFTNAADTTTTGLDLVADYRSDFGRYGQVKWSLGYNYNKTEIDKLASTPGALAAIGVDQALVDHVSQGYLTDSYPRSKLILGSDWRIGDFTAALTLTRHDKVTERDSGGPQFDQTYGAKWITDVEFGYDLSDNLNLVLGASNLFDVKPDEHKYPNGNTNGFPPYANAPFDDNGAYWYTRIAYNF